MTIIAVNIDEITPMDKVTANPLIGPVPKINNIIHGNRFIRVIKKCSFNRP